jgi:hypothetical protein
VRKWREMVPKWENCGKMLEREKIWYWSGSRKMLGKLENGGEFIIDTKIIFFPDFSKMPEILTETSKGSFTFYMSY